MLSVRIHLDHIGIFAADRVFISKLQGAPVPQIKDMGYQRMSVCLYDPVRRVRGRVIHDQNIRNLRDLRAFQLLQHPLYIFLLIVCRNDNQQFFLFLLYHRIFLILSRKAAAPTAVPRSRNLQDALTPPARTPCAGPDSGSGSPQLPLPPQRQARTKSRPPRL